MRMPDGSLIRNSVLVEHLFFKIHKVDLLNDDGSIILPSEQVLLGPAEHAGAHHKLINPREIRVVRSRHKHYYSSQKTGMDLTMWGPWAQDLVGALF